MRKKAERQIREAAAVIGESNRYRIDEVRAGTDLVRKVFDKTILDMARVGSIELIAADVGDLAPRLIRNLIRQDDRVFVYFSFLETAPRDPASGGESDTLDIILTGFERRIWERFEYLCRIREHKSPLDKIRDMIEAYNRDG